MNRTCGWSIAFQIEIQAILSIANHGVDLVMGYSDE